MRVRSASFFTSAHREALAARRENVKGPRMIPMRSLLLSTSLASVMAATALASSAVAQEAPQPEREGEATIPAHTAQEVPLDEDAVRPVTHIIIAPAPEEGEDGEPAGTELPEDAAEEVVAIPSVWAPIPTDEEGISGFGRFLAGRYALSRGETAVGAEQLRRAYQLTPEQPRLREQAFTGAILAGDLEFAARIAPDDASLSPVIVEAGRLVKGIQTYKLEGARRANAYLRDNPVGLPHDRAAVYAQVWIAAEAGDWDRALAAPPADFDPISILVARSNRARLLEIRRRHDEADAEWKELVAHAAAGALFRLPYGEFLERRGRRDEALAIYEAAVAANQADARIIEAKARVEAKGRAPAPLRYREGVAMSLRTAADQMIAQRAHEFAAVYARLAQSIVPQTQTQLVIGQSLINGGLDTAGRAALAEVPENPPAFYASARAQRAASFDKADRDEEALAEYRLAAQARPQEAAYQFALASQLIKMKRYEEALQVLDGPVLNHAQQGYEVRFLRGAAYESLGRVDEAEAELWNAYQGQPNNPTVLNYLGYLWVDSGRRVEEGAALIARAFAADPQDGNIQDSLGWAQFKQGQLEQALENLEQAVAKEPANAEINDHLGDAYWAVGRQREAGFQWERVLTLEVDDERRAEVEAKLRERLGREPATVTTPTVELAD